MQQRVVDRSHLEPNSADVRSTMVKKKKDEPDERGPTSLFLFTPTSPGNLFKVLPHFGLHANKRNFFCPICIVRQN